jgi:hypothetical protein
METGTLEKKIAKLPDNLKIKVESFVDALLMADNRVAEPELIYKTSRKPKPIFGNGKGTSGEMADDFDEPFEGKPKLKREFGGMKGFVTYMADDFNAPLDEFKEYM